MTPLEATLQQIGADLEGRSGQWALIGGFAVSARAEPRFTRDIDLAIAVRDDAEAEAFVHTLLEGGFVVATMIEHQQTQRLATVRLLSTRQPAGAQVFVDVLFASSGIEPEIVAAAAPLEILPAVTMPVAQIGHLVALKLLARDDSSRPQDLADLLALLGVATEADLALARSSCELITERGYHRDRDLASALEELLRR